MSLEFPTAPWIFINYQKFCIGMDLVMPLTSLLRNMDMDCRH